ncbi:hypothetical protein CK203_025036 [Vitis vinifera]|uniref:Aspartic peptidase DDI1-type domain-containing protein n=1 Tax=Vitis vinifera TaxID=29760 RepID=A0A438J721_VITVI|nr:hypothetical protein CK203_025036 [Vitis vinifera]
MKDSSKRKEDHDSTVEATPEKVLIKGEVKVNISLLDMIKQVSTYAKFLKDLCTIKRGLNVNKKTFLTEQVSAIIQCKSPLRYKDLGCPTISVMIGGTVVEKTLLDLGASVNLLPYSVYKQLGLDELKPAVDPHFSRFFEWLSRVPSKSLLLSMAYLRNLYSFSRGLLSYVCSALRHKICVSKTFTLDKACDKRSFTDLSFPQQPQLQPPLPIVESLGIFQQQHELLLFWLLSSA